MAEALPVVAITGATGFIGRRLVPLLAADGWQPRILVRRDPADLAWGGLQIDVVPGDLADGGALKRLVGGSAAVVHLAGLIKATHRDAYLRANVEGTRALTLAMRDAAPRTPLLLVSSLAAREPQLSGYAASKRGAEDVARELLADRLSILRPPAVYGPGDRETLAFFKLAALPWVPLLGTTEARNAVIHVDDLGGAIVRMLRQPPSATVLSIADRRPEGYSWREIMSAAVEALGARPRGFRQLPPSLLKVAARGGDLGRVFGQANMLNSEKLAELLHPDWSVKPYELGLPGWQARFTLGDGFADAVRGYRARGWLRSR